MHKTKNNDAKKDDHLFLAIPIVYFALQEI